jgi:catechol 2,3-dioxygenase-like lactoylglutathione lyase family enzyme
MQISAVTLRAPRDSLDAMRSFYGDLLGLPGDSAALSWQVGSARLSFTALDGGAPFYHFALLVPGNRFAAASAWLADRAELLPHPDSGRTDFDFDFWDAQACYVHDPAGSIVELIAHRGEAERADGEFSAADLVAISEVGLVAPDPGNLADRIRDELGISLWYGDVVGESSLAFVGRKAHTLILCRPGRGWLPTGRPAEIHPVDVTLSGGSLGEVGVALRSGSADQKSGRVRVVRIE